MACDGCAYVTRAVAGVTRGCSRAKLSSHLLQLLSKAPAVNYTRAAVSQCCLPSPIAAPNQSTAMYMYVRLTAFLSSTSLNLVRTGSSFFCNDGEQKSYMSSFRVNFTS